MRLLIITFNKKIRLSFIVITSMITLSCTKTIDKPLNIKDFSKIKEAIYSNENYSAMKKSFIIDNLSKELRLLELGKTIGNVLGKDENQLKMSTFREEISNSSIAYDSILKEKIKISNDNKRLNDFIELTNANTVSIDKYKGYLNMTLKFNNQFEKEILYIILNYKYVNKYDSEFFNEKTKLTDQVAGNFKGELEISTTEKYNDVSEFMYTKVPVRAEKKLRDKLGGEKADKKVKLDFLMEGLKVETLKVIFKDKSELVRKNAGWKYYEK